MIVFSSSHSNKRPTQKQHEMEHDASNTRFCLFTRPNRATWSCSWNHLPRGAHAARERATLGGIHRSRGTSTPDTRKTLDDRCCEAFRESLEDYKVATLDNRSTAFGSREMDGGQSSHVAKQEATKNENLEYSTCPWQALSAQSAKAARKIFPR